MTKLLKVLVLAGSTLFDKQSTSKRNESVNIEYWYEQFKSTVDRKPEPKLILWGI